MALNPNRNYAATAAGARTGAEVDEGLRSYMLRVYNYMALGVAGTGLITLFMAMQPDLMYTLAVGPIKWVLFAAVLGMGFFSGKIVTMKSVVGAQAFYWVYCALWGVMISPLIYAFLQTPGGVLDIARAFFITAGMFAAVSLYGYVTKRDLAPIAKFLFMAIVGLIIAGLVNWIFFEPSSEFSMIFSVVAVLLFAGMTAYETQMIKNMYMEHLGQDAVSKMAIFGALQLYGSFVVMFIHILNIIGIMRSE
ncbi:MAG: Bax inhibitor-1/YccA family protein [Marivibrio sp.]|uniref:Bax inhibitor-1/YccA family protein n=1 Tax=Marivibrio sp. TaxID=2039719 RepID=UPI0032ED4920